MKVPMNPLEVETVVAIPPSQIVATGVVLTPAIVATAVMIQPVITATVGVGAVQIERPNRIRRWFWTVGLFVALVAGLVLVASAVLAQGVDIPLDRVHRGDPGDRFLEAEIGATQEIGWTCGLTLERRNNESTHPGTNLIIVSGANTFVFSDIESEAFEQATGAIVIDGDILVYTQIGVDGVSSMGFRLEIFECNPPPDEITTTTTTTPTVTTTEPPPINGIDTGGGACADGACDGWSLSPLQTWVLFGVVWFLLAGLAWAFVHGATRRHDG